ncbi:MAG: hypothetical protein ACFFCW_50020 [Candidatus Hodarchaeota archaeon]
MGKFREHGVMLYLSPELYVGFVKVQADKSLGRSYAALLCFNEGLRKLGYITDEVYEVHKKKYSEPLVQGKTRPLTIEELREQEKIGQLEKHFSEVSKQWPNLCEKARLAHITKAKQYVNEVSNAKLVLALENGNNESEVMS